MIKEIYIQVLPENAVTQGKRLIGHNFVFIDQRNTLQLMV